jgi:glycosyltransferase involved in cell wall biosynthesis
MSVYTTKPPVEKSRNLVVFNYAMDVNDPIFSHQEQAVRALAPFFKKVLVFTNRLGSVSQPENVKIIDLSWKPNSPFRNIIRFLVNVLPRLRWNQIIFSHMTEVQSAIIAPLTKLLRIDHHLWYAHKSLSLYMRWNRFWVKSILTSTAGSCPISSKKVVLIGQAIDADQFPFLEKFHRQFNYGVHLGRFDSSKKIEELVNSIQSLRSIGYPVSITQIGSPSSKFQEYEEKVRARYRQPIKEKWFIILPSIPRAQINCVLSNFDFFIHAFDGSLDKTLIEATLSGIPVITSNWEYANEFGSWAGTTTLNLIDEYLAIVALTDDEISRELARRHEIATSKHSLSQWTGRLVTHLLSFEKP